MSQVSYGSITITDATDGVQSALIYLYQESPTTPSVPSQTLTYDFSTNTLSGALGQWQQSTSGLNPSNTIWLITAMALSSENVDSILSSEWSEPRQVSQSAGQDGQDGLNQATVFIYKRGTTATTPTEHPRYTFATGNFTPPNGWYKSIPAADGNPCFVTAAVVISRDTSALVGDWATPTILAQDGVDGISPTVSKEGHTVTITDAAGNVVTVTDGASGTSYYTHIRYADNSSGANMSSSPTGKTYVGMYSGTSQTAPATANSYTWSKYVGNQGVSITAVKEVYYHTTGSAPAQNTLVNGTPITSTSTAGNVWTTVVPTYITGGKYYTSLQTSLSDGTSPVFSTIILNQGLTDSNYNAAVANSVASSANENALGAMSISRATQQHFWFNSTTSGTLEAGAYITDTPIDTFKNGKTGGYLLARSDGLELGRGTNKFMTLDSSALKFHNTSGAVTSTFGNSIALASNGALIVIGATGSNNSNIYITSTELQLRRGTTANAILGSSGFIIGATGSGNSNVYITSTELQLRRGTTANATLNSNGLILTKGGIEAGTKNSDNYIYLWTNDDATNHTLAINNSGNKSDWRIIAGKKFGVDKAGNLYASNATITGKITVSSGSDLSEGLGNYSTTQDMEEAIGAATSELNDSIWNATNGYTILWNYSAFATANNGEGYICKLDPATGTKSDANGTVMWNGTVRTITKQMINPNSIVSFNIPIYVVCRLSSATATTGTNYVVWYNSEWKYATLPTPTAVGGTWTWAEATDIILGKFVMSASEAAFTECEIFDPPRSSKQITTDTTTARSANSLANTANTTANTANTTANTANTTANKALSQSAWYATCSTAAATTAKVATITPTTTAFTLSAGTTVNVKFSTTNSGAVGSITLNVNSTGAKNIKYINNNAISNIPAAGYIIANATYQFVYDGTYWVIQNLNYNSDTATTYITDIDSKKGITVKPSDSSGNDYLQMNSTDIRFVRNNIDVINLTDSIFRIGRASSGHSTIKSDGLHVWTGEESTATNEVAFFGSTMRVGVVAEQKYNIYIDGNGIKLRYNTAVLNLIDQTGITLKNSNGTTLAEFKSYINVGYGNNSNNYSGSAVIGTGLLAGRERQIVIGSFNNQNSDATFIVGDGPDSSSRSNLFSIFNIGNKDIGIMFSYYGTNKIVISNVVSNIKKVTINNVETTNYTFSTPYITINDPLSKGDKIVIIWTTVKSGGYITIGDNTYSQGLYGIAQGISCSATGDASFAAGPNFLNTTKPYVVASGEASMARGSDGMVQASGPACIALGAGDSNVIAGGGASIAAGCGNIATHGGGSLAMGVTYYETDVQSITANRPGSYALGYCGSYVNTTILANADGSLVLGHTHGENGDGPVTIKTDFPGRGSVVFGYGQEGTMINKGPGSLGFGAVVENGNIQINPAATATTSSLGSHKQGGNLVGGIARNSTLCAESMGSFVRGYATNSGTIQTNSYGDSAQGYANGGTISTNGKGAFALGYAPSGTTMQANHDGAIALNVGTIANTSGQTAIGSYNVVDDGLISRHPSGSAPYGCYALIIGNGSSNSNRSNALTVDWTGNIRSARPLRTLWTGAYHMSEGQTANLSENVSEQLSGIVLCWSAYESGEAKNYNWDYQFVPKWHVLNYNGTGVDYMMMVNAATNTTICKKYVYIYNNKITGNANNNKTGTGFANNAKVLRAVLGV